MQHQMEDSEPANSALPKVPIPVEESRAQRLQKSQARFRDRGGIFVPTARNTLVDILLGRKVASPKKGRGRSASLSPKKKSVKKDARNNNEVVKAVRTSPRKAIQRHEPEAGHSGIHVQSVASKHKTTKEFAKEAATPVIPTSKAKVKKDSKKLSTKKRGRKPKIAAQDAETPPANHDPTPLAKFQSATKITPTKRVSRAAKSEKSRLDSSAETTSELKPERSPKASPKTLIDGVAVESGANVKKSSHPPKSKKSAASKQKPAASVDDGSKSAPLQQSSTGVGLSKSRKTSASKDDQRIDEVHSKIVKGKGKEKVPQSTDLGDKPDVTAVEVPPKSRKKRARPAESEMESPLSPKRAKRTLSEEAKSNASRKKASRAKKETIEENNTNVSTESKGALSKSPLSKKRAREPDDEQAGTQRKKTKGVVHVNLTDEAVGKQVVKSKEESKKNKKVEKTKKPPASKPSRAKKGTAKALNQDKSSAETKTEPGVVFIRRIRPRKSVILRMKEPQPHQIVNDDPDPINFLC